MKYIYCILLICLSACAVEKEESDISNDMYVGPHTANISPDTPVGHLLEQRMIAKSLKEQTESMKETVKTKKKKKKSDTMKVIKTDHEHKGIHIPTGHGIHIPGT